MNASGTVQPPFPSSAKEFEPPEYARWRQSALGRITERLEQDAIFELAGDLRGKRVLDLGCGDGTYAVGAARRGARAVGVDISAAMLEVARRRGESQSVSVEWCRARGESLPFAAASFDVLMAVTLLCLVRKPLAVMAEASRVLRPGGVLVLGELGRYSWWALWRRVRGWFGSALWSSAHFWSLGEVRGLMQEAGVEAVQSRGCVYYPPVPFAARALGRLDPALRFLGQAGAAFLAVRGEKTR